MSTATAAPSKTYKGMPQIYGNFDHQIFFSFLLFLFFFWSLLFQNQSQNQKNAKKD